MEQPHAGLQKGPQNPLLAELRKSPFRPVQIEELAQLKEGRCGKPCSVRIDAEGYRTLYEHTFAFTASGGSLNLALLEVGFRLGEDGSASLTKRFNRYEGFMKEALGKGLAITLANACRIWEARAKRICFDPNDEAAQAEAYDCPPGEAYDWLRPVESKILDLGVRMGMKRMESAGLFELSDFRYSDGFPARLHVPGENAELCKTRLHAHPNRANALCRILSQHSHNITHLKASSFFPSRFDASAPVIWAIIDIEFIRKTLKDGTIADSEKIRRIIQHHVDGMAGAACVGTWAMCKSGLVPLVRAK